MRTIIQMTALAACLAAAAGCSTPQTVAEQRGQGSRQVYSAPFNAVWRAAIDAAQLGDLQIIETDRDAGFISSRRGVRIETFGENVGIWVTPLSENQTEVEVISRQAGPPKLWLKNWEDEILRAVAANLTREGPAIGAPDAGTVTGTGSAL